MRNILDLKVDTGDFIIEKVLESDIEYIMSWISDQSLYKYWGQQIKEYELDARLMLEKYNNTDAPRLGIRDKKSNNIIGEILLYNYVNNEVTIGYRIARSMQGHSIISTCLKPLVDSIFEITEIAKIKAMVDVRNVASWKVLEKAGFTKTQTITQGKMIDVICDYYIYEILKK